MKPAFGRPDVSALGDTFLVVGQQYGYTPQVITTVGARVRGSDGAVLDATPKGLGGGYVRSTAVATLGDKWIYGFISNWTHDDSNADTGIGFMSADGTLSGSSGVTHFSTAGGNGIHELALAASGSAALLVQSAEVTSGVETDMIGWIIQPNGAQSAMINFTPWREDQYRPRVAWDGAQFIIAYQDQRNAYGVNSLEPLDARSDLFGMRVRPDGTIVDPQGFVFSATRNSETHPNVAAAGGASLVLGSIFRPETGIVAYRGGYTQYGGSNQWPVVQAAASPDNADVPVAIAFSSAGTSDPDGGVQSYLWDFGDGSTATEANPTHTYTAGGEYVAVLTVTDNAGAQTSQTVRVDAHKPNQAPVAVAKALPSSGPAPLDVTLTAAGSYDPDGVIGNYKWVFHDGSEYWGPTAYNTYNEPGTYAATLYVYDMYNAVGSAGVTVNVGFTQPTATPTATLTATQAPPTSTRTPTATPRGPQDQHAHADAHAHPHADAGADRNPNPDRNAGRRNGNADAHHRYGLRHELPARDRHCSYRERVLPGHGERQRDGQERAGRRGAGRGRVCHVDAARRHDRESVGHHEQQRHGRVQHLGGPRRLHAAGHEHHEDGLHLRPGQQRVEQDHHPLDRPHSGKKQCKRGLALFFMPLFQTIAVVHGRTSHMAFSPLAR